MRQKSARKTSHISSRHGRLRKQRLSIIGLGRAPHNRTSVTTTSRSIDRPTSSVGGNGCDSTSESGTRRPLLGLWLFPPTGAPAGDAVAAGDTNSVNAPAARA